MSQSPFNIQPKPASIDGIKRNIALRDLPDDILDWLCERMEYHEFDNGTPVIKKGEPALRLWFLCEGQIDYYIEVNRRLVYFYSLQNDAATGGVGGLIPFSRMKVSPGGAYAAGTVKMYTLHKNYYRELEQIFPEFVQQLIGYMTERAKKSATITLQQEKVSALGKLAAGIAHEMNNPVSAIASMSAELNKKFGEIFYLTDGLLQYRICPEQFGNIREVFEDKIHREKKRMSPLERMKIDDDINYWFSSHGIRDSSILSETFTEAGYSAVELEDLCRQLAGDEFIKVIYWMENLICSQRLITDITEASKRISRLVDAIKSHVHMDQANEMQHTDIQRDIENTITLLCYRINEKNITLQLKFCRERLMIPAYVGELNQVWANIIDNAIFAAPQNGRLVIETEYDRDFALIRFIDNGPGIPPENITLIFDPFFTTKNVGEGTGIGLDIVNRVVKKHRGKVSVDSVPGRTEFTVCIPVKENSSPNDLRSTAP